MLVTTKKPRKSISTLTWSFSVHPLKEDPHMVGFYVPPKSPSFVRVVFSFYGFKQTPF